MSAETLHTLAEAIQAHYTDMHGEGAIITDWFVAYGGMQQSDVSDDGIGYPSGYATSNSSPYAAIGVATMGLSCLEADLTPEYDDE